MSFLELSLKLWTSQKLAVAPSPNAISKRRSIVDCTWHGERGQVL